VAARQKLKEEAWQFWGGHHGLPIDDSIHFFFVKFVSFLLSFQAIKFINIGIS